MEFSRKAGNLGPMFAFIIAAPATSVSAILITYAFLGLRFTLILIAAILVTALFTGLLGTTIPVKGKAAPPCPCCVERKHENKLASALRYGFVDMGKEIIPYIAVGLIIAGAIAVLMPVAWVESVLSVGFVPLLVVLVVALAIYICPTGSVPFIAALVAKGMNLGAALVFLVLGPATNYPFLLIIWRKFGGRAFGVYLAGLVVCSLGFGMLLL